MAISFLFIGSRFLEGMDAYGALKAKGIRYVKILDYALSKKRRLVPLPACFQ